MTKTDTVRARIEPGLKKEGEAILQDLGLSASEFITMTYKQLVMRKGIPFEARVFNAESAQSIEKVRKDFKDGNTRSFASSDDAMAWLTGDDE